MSGDASMTAFGTPYSALELQRVAETQVREVYHRELMLWAAQRILDLERELDFESDRAREAAERDSDG